MKVEWNTTHDIRPKLRLKPLEEIKGGLGDIHRWRGLNMNDTLQGPATYKALYQPTPL
jgi:hypothetical protein